MGPEKSGKPTGACLGLLVVVGLCWVAIRRVAWSQLPELSTGEDSWWGELSLSLAFLQTIIQPSLFLDPISPRLHFHLPLSLSPPERTEKKSVRWHRGEALVLHLPVYPPKTLTSLPVGLSEILI